MTPTIAWCLTTGFIGTAPLILGAKVDTSHSTPRVDAMWGATFLFGLIFCVIGYTGAAVAWVWSMVP